MGFLREASHRAGLVAFATLTAVIYGIAHDMVTAHLCVEYFTIGHANLLDADPHRANPAIQALFWGVFATWWFGAAAGTLIALVARAGPEPRLTIRDLVRPVAILHGAVAASAVAAGGIGGLLASVGAIQLSSQYAATVPAEKHTLFLVDGWAHTAAYIVAAVSVLVLAGRLIGTRLGKAKRQRDEPNPSTEPAGTAEATEALRSSEGPDGQGLRR